MINESNSTFRRKNSQYLCQTQFETIGNIIKLCRARSDIAEIVTANWTGCHQFTYMVILVDLLIYHNNVYVESGKTSINHRTLSPLVKSLNVCHCG
jgi:hypothetical protein